MLEIRVANKNDAGTILGFIKELADFERLSHEVVTDESTLVNNLFGPQSNAYVLVAEIQGQAVAFAHYFFNFSTFLGRQGLYLEDLYVQPESRGHGIGLALLSRLAVIAKERNCGRMEWGVLDWNQKAIDFYLKMGAKPMGEWTTYRLTAPEIDALAKRSH